MADELAKILWDYNLLHHSLSKADAIIVMGSHETRVADWSVEVFQKGYAPVILFAGERGGITKDWEKSEAEVFKDIALEKDVPNDKILIENKSKNSGENILFSKKVLEENGVYPKKVILITKPYMERRAYALIKKRWPEIEVIISSPLISFGDYPKFLTKNELISHLVGNLQRIKIYPEKGFQIEQDIPDEVWNAYKKLVDLGYTSKLIKE